MPPLEFEFNLLIEDEVPSPGNPFLIARHEDLTTLATVVNDETSYTPSGGTASLYAAASYRLENGINLDPSTGYEHNPIGGDEVLSVSGNKIFTGTFDGNGKTLKNLTYDADHRSLGLFSRIKDATIFNLTLKDTSMTNKHPSSGKQDTATRDRNTGVLVGHAKNSLIYHVRVINGNIQGQNRVGGLVGRQEGGIISASSASVDVMGQKDNVGGLVGLSNGTITGSSAAGTVTAEGTAKNIGGLVGKQDGGCITRSSATGKVEGNDSHNGGLVGLQKDGTITDSYATGKVTGHSNTGGLVGSQGSDNSSGTITDSYAEGTVTGKTNSGGLVGAQEDGTITDSYAEGTVTGKTNSGGLVGAQEDGTITDSYARGKVEGPAKSQNLGGLVGAQESGTTIYSYATGAVSGDNNVGGLVGVQASGTITASYWDTQTSGRSSSAGGVGYLTAELQILRDDTDMTNIYFTWNTPPWVFMAGAYPTLNP